MALAEEKVLVEADEPIIRYRGVFSWEGLYRMVHDWIVRERFTPHEKRYKHKGDEVEVEVWGDKKVDVMYKYKVDVIYHVWNLKTVETVVDGKKVTTNHAKIEIKINGTVIVDYSDRFKGEGLTKQLGKWWLAITRNDREDVHMETLEDDLYRLHHEIKTYLKMESDTHAY